MSNWMNIDVESTIQDYDYTRIAAAEFERIITSEKFADMDSDMIFDYLYHEGRPVPFQDYLKRYIYERVHIGLPFKEVSDEIYFEILNNNFKMNHAPWSFSSAKKSLTQTLKAWLRQDSVKRSTVFLLGFGLRMRETDVSEFLQKGIREEDFDFTSPEETVYWFCYHFDLRYAQAVSLLSECAQISVQTMDSGRLEDWQEVIRRPDFESRGMDYLRDYLRQLKASGIGNERNAHVYQEFRNLYDRARRAAIPILQEHRMDRNRPANIAVEDVGPSDLEMVLCSGIPSTSSGNLKKTSDSSLSEHFHERRPERHRFDNLLKKRVRVNRFDLITLLFFVYSQEVEPDWPCERFLKFVDEINQILTRCHMLELYPANPYEAFVSMCLVSDEPLAVYNEVWERSYQDETVG